MGTRVPVARRWAAPSTWLVLAGVAMAYYGLARFGLLFSLSDTLASPIWPPTGFAIAAVALWRGPAALGVLIGAVVAEWAGSGNPAAALGIGLGNTSEALLGGFALARLGGPKAFERLDRTAGFLLVAATAPLASVAFGIGSLVAAGTIPAAAAAPAAWTWYLGDAAGALVIAPLLIQAVRHVPRRAEAQHGTEAALAVATLLTAAALVLGFIPGVAPDWPALVILLMPPLVWVGYRVGPVLAIGSVAAVDALAIAATRVGRGPFHAATPNDAFLLLQSFILTAAAMVLALGAVRTERQRAEAHLEALVADRTGRLSGEIKERARAEAALRDSHAALAEAQRIARIGSWSLDLASQTASASTELFALLGIEPRDGPVPLAALQVHMDAADLQGAEAIMAAAVPLQAAIGYDVRVRPPGQPERILHVEGRVDRPAGQMRGTMQEVTRQRTTEAALRRSNAALAEAQRIAGIGSWDLDLAADRVAMSPEMSRLVGVPARAEPVPGKTLLERVDPKDVEAAQAALRRSMQANVPLSIDLRLRPVAGGAAVVWLHMEGRLDPQTGHMVGTGQDVTADRASAAALRESLERFKVLADASPLGVFHTATTGRVDYANPRWGEISGCDYRDFEAIRAAVHPDDRDALTASWRAAMAAGKDLTAEFRYRHKNGKDVSCSTRASPVRDSQGNITGWVGILDDVTERRALEAREREFQVLREQAAFKTEFLRTAAHELGNPLTPIKIQLRILRNFVHDPAHAQGRKSVEILDRNVERLHLLVRDMLESARLQAGRLKLVVRPMDLSHVVHEVTETFQESAIENGVALDMESPPTLDLVADPDRVTQVLYNLLSNAMKFTPRGGRIHVQVIEASEQVIITVADTGAGFTADQAGGLFQPFGQVHDAVPGKGGTGLGLYISKGIVEQHGGRILAHSDGPGRGAIFTVQMPRVAVVIAADAETARQEEPNRHD